MKLYNGLGDAITNLSDMGFKIGESCVEIVCGGEDGIGGGDKRVEVSEDASFKVCSCLLPRKIWLLPRRWKLLPRKWRLLPRKWTMRSGSMV